MVLLLILLLFCIPTPCCWVSVLEHSFSFEHEPHWWISPCCSDLTHIFCPLEFYLKIVWHLRLPNCGCNNNWLWSLFLHLNKNILDNINDDDDKFMNDNGQSKSIWDPTLQSTGLFEKSFYEYLSKFFNMNKGVDGLLSFKTFYNWDLNCK